MHRRRASNLVDLVLQGKGEVDKFALPMTGPFPESTAAVLAMKAFLGLLLKRYGGLPILHHLPEEE
jgi:hypothetical protein